MKTKLPWHRVHLSLPCLRVRLLWIFLTARGPPPLSLSAAPATHTQGRGLGPTLTSAISVCVSLSPTVCASLPSSQQACALCVKLWSYNTSAPALQFGLYMHMHKIWTNAKACPCSTRKAYSLVSPTCSPAELYAVCLYIVDVCKFDTKQSASQAVQAYRFVRC
jgi:hypothetical protein